jgi:hypothetical protein
MHLDNSCSVASEINMVGPLCLQELCQLYLVFLLIFKLMCWAGVDFSA